MKNTLIGNEDALAQITKRAIDSILYNSNGQTTNVVHSMAKEVVQSAVEKKWWNILFKPKCVLNNNKFYCSFRTKRRYF